MMLVAIGAALWMVPHRNSQGPQSFGLDSEGRGAGPRGGKVLVFPKIRTLIIK